jgi:phytoene/squalene synthetase
VLRIAGYTDEALARSSDALCTALQLTNFWQDFGHDWIIGRLYVPRDVVVACRARERECQRQGCSPSHAASPG